jgi:hypothetical protein
MRASEARELCLAIAAEQRRIQEMEWAEDHAERQICMSIREYLRNKHMKEGAQQTRKHYWPDALDTIKKAASEGQESVKFSFHHVMANNPKGYDIFQGMIAQLEKNLVEYGYKIYNRSGPKTTIVDMKQAYEWDCTIEWVDD